LKVLIEAGEHLAKGKREGVADFLVKLNEDLQELVLLCTDDTLKDLISGLAQKALDLESQERGDQKKDGKGYWHHEFSEAALQPVREGLESVAKQAGFSLEDSTSVDAPRPFLVSELPDFVEALAADVSGRDAQFVDSLKLRIRGLFSESQLTAFLDPDNTAGITLDKWLNDYVGENEAASGPLAVLDLSLVPSEVIHIVIAVLARLIFEAVQRYRRLRGSVLPAATAPPHPAGYAAVCLSALRVKAGNSVWAWFWRRSVPPRCRKPCWRSAIPSFSIAW
jgi:hypothetical protein